MIDDPAEVAEPLNLGLLLFIPYRSMESAVLAHLKAHGHDLPLSQARVFQRIGPDGSRLGELAQAAQVSKQTVGSVVDQLERAGYVSRTPDPTDARARLVLLTDRGRELVELSLPVVRQIESAWQTHLGAARTRELRSALEKLREITDPFAEPRTR
ncbi:MarR family winged helix-turn-helix transcriptional regulator [Friedmanniella luteola]|uniref:MarR family winged helix-turn-helix transcriptional regulator n=1 Tax=Friedmanniella luteola TaxID=546871 RepID=UPI001E4971FC|nr:MarR family transcriptional regulator [Friedmanniella luteola]